jgi:hypothetical protein
VNFNPLIGLNNAFGDMLLNFVMGARFIVLPAFWVSALAWAGFRVGNMLSGLNSGTVQARNAGSTGADFIVKAVK